MASDPRVMSEQECTGNWCCGKTCLRSNGDVRSQLHGLCGGCALRLHSQLSTALRERDEARGYALRCAQAIGVSYEADGHASQPGPIEDVERHIVEARRKADAADELRRDAEVVRGGHWDEVIAERDAALRERDEARRERDVAKLRADAMTADANARTLERDSALRRAQEAEAPLVWRGWEYRIGVPSTFGVAGFEGGAWAVVLEAYGVALYRRRLARAALSAEVK